MSDSRRVALLSVDLQYLDAMPDRGIFLTDDVSARDRHYYFERLQKLVIPNTAKLQRAFRDKGLEIVHTRIQSMTADGRDRSLWHKRLKLHAAPGSKEAEFLPETAPVDDELVFNKTASGVFASTNIEYVLRNLGVVHLFVAGVFTNECVASAVRAGCDRGFDITLVQDCCAAVSEQLEKAAIDTLRDRYCDVVTVDAAIAALR